LKVQADEAMQALWFCGQLVLLCCGCAVLQLKK
jgi:hypothetical protein